MRVLDGVVDAIRRRAVAPFARRWSALDSDYKSVTLAFALVGLVVGLGVPVPW